ncbi:MAG: T9SS type A sorting domain-containing protein [Melioribacteraceae bacterium]|jgi:hypothetical protein|nr:T9SS type A sorting domain-containing protein [Melioribacteraceae bacterium]
MKSKILIRLFPLLLFIIQTTFGQFSEMDFPLGLGNIWQYSEFPGHVSQSEAVRDTLMPNGKLYTFIEGSLVGGYLRKNGAKIYFYDSIDNTEKLKYDFNLTVGDTLSVQIFGEDSVITTVSAKGTKSIFGQEKDYMIFHHESVSSTADGEYTIVDGLGLTQYSGEGLFYGLTGAIIDGIKYGTIVSVERQTENIPTEFGITQNYPNPFNPTTKIEYFLLKSSSVEIKLYDILGNYMQTLLSEYKTSGRHHISFDGSNLSSGIYFYSIEVEDKIKTKSMVLLK